VARVVDANKSKTEPFPQFSWKEASGGRKNGVSRSKLLKLPLRSPGCGQLFADRGHLRQGLGTGEHVASYHRGHGHFDRGQIFRTRIEVVGGVAMRITVVVHALQVVLETVVPGKWLLLPRQRADGVIVRRRGGRPRGRGEQRRGFEGGQWFRVADGEGCAATWISLGA